MGLHAGKPQPEGAQVGHFHCRTPCEIFIGRSALWQAVYWCKTGRVCHKVNELYHLQHHTAFEKACSWHSGATSIPSQEELEGCGVHAKMYQYEDYLIFSSQNNGSSPLFETALVFKKKPRLLQFFTDSFDKALRYQMWWKNNKTYR